MSRLKTPLISLLSTRTFRPLNRIFLRQRIAIFGLHRFIKAHSPFVQAHEPEFIRTCIKLLKKKGIPLVSLRDVAEAIRIGRRLPDGAVAFTIDDGHWDQAEVGAKIFLQEKCPVTIFLITGFLDGITWPTKLEWLFERIPVGQHNLTICEQRFTIDTISNSTRFRSYFEMNKFLRSVTARDADELLDNLAEYFSLILPHSAPRDQRPMTWQVARELEKKGVVFGPHSVTHRALSSLADEQARNEIETSWRRLLEELDNPLPIMAWPFGQQGDYLNRDIAFAKNANLIGAVATGQDYAKITGVPQTSYSLKRLSMPTNETDFLQLSSWVERANLMARSVIGR